MMSGIPSAIDNSEQAWVGDVIRFWFEELPAAHWFAKNAGVDAQIHDRFLALHERLKTDDGRGVTGPRATLAAVIVLDQFSRNLFRDSPRAYAADPIARRLSRMAIEQGFDLAMTKDERHLLYLPFQHSEDREDQALSLALIERLGDEEWTRYALAHKVIIERFSRFPHRNAILNRRSTAEEIALLKEPMTSF